jgi:hypothetical protein
VERIVPRLVCPRFGRFVVVRHYDRCRIMYWTGSGWSRSVRAARLYHDIADVEAVINRVQPPSHFT